MADTDPTSESMSAPRLLAVQPVTSGSNDACILRLQVNGSIKYLILAKTFHRETVFNKVRYNDFNLPPLPETGGWKSARLSRTQGTSEVVFSDFDQYHHELETVETVWHKQCFDVADFDMTTNLHPRRNIVFKATHPSLAGPVLLKLANFNHQINRIDNETKIYHHLDDHDVAPKFLGHVSENGRVIGFVTQYIEGARHPHVGSSQDYKACAKVLDDLHEIGVYHGDLHRGNVLIDDHGKASLVDFENARIQGEKVDLERPMLMESVKCHTMIMQCHAKIDTKQDRGSV